MQEAIYHNSMVMIKQANKYNRGRRRIAGADQVLWLGRNLIYPTCQFTGLIP